MVNNPESTNTNKIHESHDEKILVISDKLEIQSKYRYGELNESMEKKYANGLVYVGLMVKEKIKII
jgi:hypothetical protein